MMPVKPLICILSAVLLSASAWAQDGKLLSYTREFKLPDKDYKELLESLLESYQENSGAYDGWARGYALGDGLSLETLDYDAKVLAFRGRVENYTGVSGLRDGLFGSNYAFSYTMSISLTGDRVLFEMTEIRGQMNGNSLSRKWGTLNDYMTEGTDGVRGGLYGPVWRRSDRILRGYLQEFFDQATQRMCDSVTD